MIAKMSILILYVHYSNQIINLAHAANRGCQLNLLKDPVTTPQISNRMLSLISIDLYSGLAGSSSGGLPRILIDLL